ncbi:MAG: PSD1 and planctomycete cytochrome C domain-containing protein [Verrucomicrobiota bacterium]
MKSSILTVTYALSAIAVGLAAETQTVDFSRDIRPILSSRCFNCHGPDGASRKAGLRLDHRDNAIELEAIVPGDPELSYLIERIITNDPDDRMPPKGAPLSAEEIETFRAWIDTGAHYEQHWAYVKPDRPKPPKIKPVDWHQSNPIDHFIQRRLTEHGLQPSPPAEPAVLIRRLSLDLIGLPPTIEAVAAFERDPSEVNYEAFIEHLLDSPKFGEKWALHWLDLARYADSNGYQHDDLRSMWPYRDWVIRALNADLPFDQFTIEQLAGDLLPNPTREQLIATGFHRNVPTNFSGGTKVEEVRANVLHDRVSTTGQVWLGMTMECCQCHDHKFDPIPQTDYYQLYAYFNQAVPEVAQKGKAMFKKLFVGADLPVVASPEDGARVMEIIEQMTLEKAALEKAKPWALAEQPGWEKEFLASGRGESIPWERFPWNLRGGYQMLKIPAEKRSDNEKRNVEALLFYDHPFTGPYEKALDMLKDTRDTLAPRTMIMKDQEDYVPTNLFIRGDYTSPGAPMKPGVPSVLHPLDPEYPMNRLGLAQWLVDAENPLTARVTVNRFWAEIFGQGIVSTPEDFGYQSPHPTHPDLLDWLALEFVEGGWSMKQLIKTIVMSSTYRQTAAVSSAKIAKDPSNQWLGRGPRFRLPAELIRDNLLAISGQLSDKFGGPAVYPPQPAGLWKEISGADDTFYPTSDGEDRHRRGLYTFLRRGNPNPMVLNFDGSNRSACVTKRDRSNTPVQALNLLNDPIYVDAAREFEAWIERVPGNDQTRVISAFRRALARRPSQSEVAALIAIYQKHGNWFSVAQVLLNLDETITKS